jgi:hypothetical protein
MTPEETKHYEMVCRHGAPYPLNYLPYGDDGQRFLGCVVGMMIEKGMFKK